MPTEPREGPMRPPDIRAGDRLHLLGIREMPAGYDAEVAELFRDFRAASNLSETDLAAKLATRVEVVQALEQGALFALPPWAETCRVVSGYGVLLNLDVRPLLRRIYAQIEAGIVELRTKPVPDVPVMPPAPEPMDAEFTVPQRAPQPQPYRQPVPPPPLAQEMGYGRLARPMQPQAPHPAATPQAPRSQQAPQPPQARAAAQAPTGGDKRRSGLLKWGVAALAVSGIAFGLWMVLADPDPFGSLNSAQSGSKSSPDKVLDPDDPRSRKADRLPGASSF